MEHDLKNFRTVVAVLLVDDDLAIDEDLGTIDYLDREFGWLADSGIFLDNAKILDSNDEEDAEAIEFTRKIFDI